jgi:calcineurin-like phosphoesterase family protein
MDGFLIESINSTVGENDTLYHLGDFAFGNRKNIPLFRDRIYCKNVHLIYGNHDGKLKELGFSRLFSSAQDYLEFRHNGTLFCLFHYAMDVWNEHARGSIHLYGHSHGAHDHGGRKRQDVGVDVFDKPVSIEYIIELMASREIVKVDHHSESTSYK